MTPLLPINPADFPDVPTRKALICLDLQNDFLTAEGALPVTQPDGMIERIVALAAAVRASGNGEVIWVRSQFDTARPAGEQQLVASETPQLPMRSRGSSSSTRSAPPATVAEDADAVLNGDAEAFLSVVEDDERAEPPCVRKGTKGAELFPAIAAAKGPKDYAMTKSHYSAFQSGQLLNLLRRQFATELIICGSLSNVSVYATALAASSYGLDITIVEDCCGYRSEARHMNTARRLMDQTGCEFLNAADVIATLGPRSPALATQGPVSAGGRVSHPLAGLVADIPPELIAAAMAGSRSRGNGIHVRPRPSSPPLISNPNRGSKRGETTAAEATAGRRAQTSAAPASSSPPFIPNPNRRTKQNTQAKETKTARKNDQDRAAPAPSSSRRPPSPPPTDLLVSMQSLKLSTDFSEPIATAAPATLRREDDSPQAWEHVVAWDIRA